MGVVDVVLEGSGIDEKFLGITLFALVPNTTEFMNAISFALNGNIALRCQVSLLRVFQLADWGFFSMEIGSAYALQVCLLQIPAMVAFSAWHAPEKMGSVAETFRYGGFFLTPSAPLQYLTRSLKFDLASMGRYRHHPLSVPHDLHLHRGKE